MQHPNVSETRKKRKRRSEAPVDVAPESVETVWHTLETKLSTEGQVHLGHLRLMIQAQQSAAEKAVLQAEARAREAMLQKTAENAILEKQHAILEKQALDYQWRLRESTKDYMQVTGRLNGRGMIELLEQRVVEIYYSTTNRQSARTELWETVLQKAANEPTTQPWLRKFALDVRTLCGYQRKFHGKAAKHMSSLYEYFSGHLHNTEFHKGENLKFNRGDFSSRQQALLNCIATALELELDWIGNCASKKGSTDDE